jgi:hypothetical protein
MTICTSALRITTTDTVTCALPELHMSASLGDGTDNYEPASHQGVHDGKIYIWQTRDASMMNTLRNGGFTEQCDHMGRKLAVAPALLTDSLRAMLLPLWREAAFSSDEPGNDQLVRWVKRLMERIDEGWAEVKAAHVKGALGKLDGTTGSAVALLTGATPEQLDDLGGFEEAKS